MASQGQQGLLEGYRVLDLTDELGWLAGKIMGDLGADVIKVEKPGGDTGRNIGPFYHDIPHSEKSLTWWAYNTNKRGITLDITVPSGRELFLRLAGKADFVIEGFPPGYLAEIGLGYDELHKLNPGLILVSVTPFGQSGPYSTYRASDLEIMATSGLLTLFGSPDRPPVRVAVPQSYMWAGMSAAMGALLANYYRGVSGQGQHVDLSGQASCLWAVTPAQANWDVLEKDLSRDGEFITGRSITGAKMRAIYRCRDGYINFIVYGGVAGRATNKALVAWMKEDGMAPQFLIDKEWDKFNIATVTQEEIDVIEQPIAEFLATKTKAEFFENAIERRMLGYPVATAADIATDPQLQARDFWQEVEHPELGVSITYPGGFGKFSNAPCGIKRRAPLIGEHNVEVFAEELGLSAPELVRLKESGVI
ncbi:hypothetical protein JCM15765_34200 [Paradesulfitobacterium aromaticivorans]